MRPICMGPELALPAMLETTLSREAASSREENLDIAHFDPADGASPAGTLANAPSPSGLVVHAAMPVMVATPAFASDVPFSIGITPEEVG